MHIFDKDKIVQAFLQTWSSKQNNSDKLIVEQQQQFVRKNSIETLGSTCSSNQHSIKHFAKTVLTSIADSGISLNRTGSVITHSASDSRHSAESSSSLDILSPNEDEEADRMVSQHYTLRAAFDGMDFSAPVVPLLSKKDTVILDIGCGSGTWTMEIATQFPAATFIGLDKKPLFPRYIKPKNCQFLLCDITINNGKVNLPYDDCSVDYIFQRDMNWGLTEAIWLPLMKEYYRILKPGGWIELVEPVNIYFFNNIICSGPFFFYLLMYMQICIYRTSKHIELRHMKIC